MNSGGFLEDWVDSGHYKVDYRHHWLVYVSRHRLLTVKCICDVDEDLLPTFF